MSTKDATRRLGGRARTNAVGADCRDNNCTQPTKTQQVIVMSCPEASVDHACTVIVLLAKHRLIIPAGMNPDSQPSWC